MNHEEKWLSPLLDLPDSDGLVSPLVWELSSSSAQGRGQLAKRDKQS